MLYGAAPFHVSLRAVLSIHTMCSTLGVKTVVHGYYVYRTIWEPHVGEELIQIQESGNSHSRYMYI